MLFFLGDSLTKFLRRNEELRACKLIELYLLETNVLCLHKKLESYCNRSF